LPIQNLPRRRLSGAAYLAARRRLVRCNGMPVITIIIDTANNIAASFDVVYEVTREQGLVTSEMVHALAALDDDGSDGPRIAYHSY
jgi:PII-like signaling protein